MEAPKLKACPFCGKSAQLRVTDNLRTPPHSLYVSDDVKEKRIYVIVNCVSCGVGYDEEWTDAIIAAGVTHQQRGVDYCAAVQRELVAKWNRRYVARKPKAKKSPV